MSKNNAFEIPNFGDAAQFLISSEDSSSVFPDTREVRYWDDRASRVFYIDYEIQDDYSLVELTKEIIAINRHDAKCNLPPEKRTPIIINIFSYGGDLLQAFNFVDVLLASQTPVYTVALGAVMSAAFLIFVAGKKRFAFNHSSLLIHSGSAQLQGTAEQINESAKNYKDQVTQMKDYILERTEIPERVFNKNKKNDWYLTTKEIKDYKIADIVTSLDEIV